MAVKRKRVPMSIWRDPEFVRLSTTAQWLWFYLFTRPRPARFRADVVARLAHGMTIARVEQAASELRDSSYGSVFDRKRRVQTLSRAQRRAIFERDGNICLHCGTRQQLTVDHIWPVSLGGGDDPSNLQTLCRPCNSRKGARVPEGVTL